MIFLKTDIICVDHFGTGCLKNVLDNRACFRAILGFAIYGNAYLVFSATWPVVARTRVAFQCATDARITINAFYGRNSHFRCFVEDLSQSSMDKNVKFVLKGIKATAFSSSKGVT